MALVALSVIEQRYRAVMLVLDGASVSEVAAEVGVSRQSVHAWVRRYRDAGLGPDTLVVAPRESVTSPVTAFPPP